MGHGHWLRSTPARKGASAYALLGALLGVLLLCSPLQAREVVLTTTAWEPYIGPDLHGQGYIAEVAREALARSGHTMHLTFLPWERAVHMAKTGAAHGYLPEYQSEGLQRVFLFSDPMPGGPVGFFKRKGRENVDWSRLDSLKPYRIGVVRGYVNTPEFDARADLLKDFSNDDMANLRKLVAGRIDLMLADMHVGFHLVRRLSPDVLARIEFALPPLEEKSLYACFPADRSASRQLVLDFNRGLASMKRDGTLRRLRDRHGLR